MARAWPVARGAESRAGPGAGSLCACRRRRGLAFRWERRRWPRVPALRLRQEACACRPPATKLARPAGVLHTKRDTPVRWGWLRECTYSFLIYSHSLKICLSPSTLNPHECRAAADSTPPAPTGASLSREQKNDAETCSCSSFTLSRHATDPYYTGNCGSLEIESSGPCGGEMRSRE